MDVQPKNEVSRTSAGSEFNVEQREHKVPLLEDVLIWTPRSVSRQKTVYSNPAIVLCILLATTDVFKLTGSYALRYYNHDRFPINQTLFVVIVEFIKSVVCGVIHIRNFGTSPLYNFDFRLILPSLVYAITNNIFYSSLAFVTPAVWTVLIQVRVPLTLLIYRVFLRRSVHYTQWCAAFLMIFAIGFSQVPQIQSANIAGILTAFWLAVLNSGLSSGVSVYTEMMFKESRDDTKIWRQQCQMYFGGAAFALIPYAVFNFMSTEMNTTSRESSNLFTSSAWLQGLLMITLASSVIQGICVALVVKKLDNIVKYQLACVVYLVNCVLNHLLFPDKFSITHHYIVSFLVLIYATYVYETKRFT